jgi:hypothetical protein
MRRALDLICITVFCAIIAGVPVCSALGVRTLEGDRWNETERRSKAALAPLGMGRHELKALFDSLERYCTDRIAFRWELLGVANSLRSVLGMPSRPEQVVVGVDGWWFFGNASERGIDQHRGLRTLTPEQLSSLLAYWEKIRAALAERGIPFLVVIAPDKHAVYAEYLPPHLAKAGIGPTDQLMASDLGELRVLDLRPAMREAKHASDLLLYHKNDSHWNDHGAYVAFREIMKALGVPGGFEARSTDFVRTMSSRGDLVALVGTHIAGPSETCGIRDEVFAGQVEVQSIGSPQVRTLPAAKLVRLTDEHSFIVRNRARTGSVLVLGDSFTNKLARYFSSSFGKSIYHHYFHLGDSGELSVMDLVDQHRPDAVVFEMVGRLLVTRAGRLIPPASEGMLAFSPDQLLDPCRRGQGIASAEMRDNALCLTASTADPYFQLPPMPAMPGGATVVVDITMPSERMVQMYYQTAQRPETCEEQSVRAPGGPGRCRVVLSLGGDLNGAIRLDPGNAAGEYCIHGVTVIPR